MKKISNYLEIINHRLEQGNNKIKVIEGMIEQQLKLVKKSEHERKVMETVINQSIAKLNELKRSEGDSEPRNCTEK